jgi:hypothetical protein
MSRPSSVSFAHFSFSTVSAAFGSAVVNAASRSLTVARRVSIALSIFDQGIEFARHFLRCVFR